MTNKEIIADRVAAFADPARHSYYLDLYGGDAQLHGYAGVGPGKEGIVAFYEGFWTSFPDARVIVHEMLEDGDKVVVRFSLTATHQGVFAGVPPSGRPIESHGITILRMRDGKCVERWSCADFLSVMIQIGAVPPPA